MHLSEGVLHYPTLITGYACAIVGIIIGLRKINSANISFVALFSATFFVASTIHIPIGIASVHLILNGIAGIFLGWAVFPAFLIALLLQLLLFSFGGLAVLGVNLCIMAIPALLLHYLLTPYWQKKRSYRSQVIIGCLAASLGIIGSILIAALFLALDNGKQYYPLIALLLVSHIPVLIVDSLISAGIMSLLTKMRPQIYEEIN